jgi:hypothetical protein
MADINDKEVVAQGLNTDDISILHRDSHWMITDPIPAVPTDIQTTFFGLVDRESDIIHLYRRRYRVINEGQVMKRMYWLYRWMSPREGGSLVEWLTERKNREHLDGCLECSDLEDRWQIMRELSTLWWFDPFKSTNYCTKKIEEGNFGYTMKLSSTYPGCITFCGCLPPSPDSKPCVDHFRISIGPGRRLSPTKGLVTILNGLLNRRDEFELPQRIFAEYEAMKMKLRGDGRCNNETEFTKAVELIGNFHKFYSNAYSQGAMNMIRLDNTPEKL